MKHYIVATQHRWNVQVFRQRISRLPGGWHLVEQPETLVRRADHDGAQGHLLPALVLEGAQRDRRRTRVHRLPRHGTCPMAGAARRSKTSSPAASVQPWSRPSA